MQKIVYFTYRPYKGGSPSASPYETVRKTVALHVFLRTKPGLWSAVPSNSDVPSNLTRIVERVLQVSLPVILLVMLRFSIFLVLMSPRYLIVENLKNVSIRHMDPNLLMSPRAKTAKRVITTGSPVSAVLPCWNQQQ